MTWGEASLGGSCKEIEHMLRDVKQIQVLPILAEGKHGEPWGHIGARVEKARLYDTCVGIVCWYGSDTLDVFISLL